MSRAPRRLPPPLLALTPGDLDAAAGRALLPVIRHCAENGLRGVLLREPALGDREYLELARELRELLRREHGAWLGLHDRPHLALAADADGVHLGGRSLRAALVRSWLAPEIALGLSTHRGDDPASWLDADYLFHGPVLETHKGSTRVEGIGFAALAGACAAARAPVWALGGLAPEHAAQVRASGAHGFAVLSGVLSRPDAAARVRAYAQAWEHCAGC